MDGGGEETISSASLLSGLTFGRLERMTFEKGICATRVAGGRTESSGYLG
jgi:hypothetical protein